MPTETKCQECLENVLKASDFKCCAKVGSAKVFHYYCASINKANFLKVPKERMRFCSKCAIEEDSETTSESSSSDASEQEDVTNLMEYQEGDWGCIRKLFLGEDSSDCDIVIKFDGVDLARFPCHQLILRTCSDFLSAKIPIPKTDRPTISIGNASPRAMVTVLEFMYYGCVALEDWCFTCDVLRTSAELKVKRLVDMCERFLEKEINTSNVCYILDMAITCESTRLMTVCSQLCRDAGFIILKTRAFRETRKNVLKYILKIPDLLVENEMLFNAVWDWCTLKCCQSGILPNEACVSDQMVSFFPLMGFEFMSDEELECIPDCVLDKVLKLYPEIKLGGAEKDKPTDVALRSRQKHRDTNWRKLAFLNEKHCDCTVVVENFKNTVTFPCHKLSLCVASDVFEKLFSAIPEGDAQIVTITDLVPRTMYTFLKYILLDVIELDEMKSACDVYTGANRYHITGLIPYCLRYIEMTMSPHNVCYALEYAITRKSDELKDMCIQFIWWNNLTKIMNSREFQEMSQETLKSVLKLECVKSRISTLDFNFLWKLATLWCCKQKLPATRENIWNEMNPFSEYIDLKNLTKEEINCVPDSFLENLYEKTKSKEKGQRSDIEVEKFDKNFRWNGRKLNFPLSLPKYVKTFKTLSESFPPIYVKRNVVLFKFLINVRSVLPEFSISHLGPPMFNYMRSLHIYSTVNSETLAKYRYQDDDDFQMTATECSDEREITFKALRLLVVEPYVDYAVEVNYEKEVSNLIWPLVSLKNNVSGDMELTLVTEHCYGLNYISFIPTC